MYPAQMGHTYIDVKLHIIYGTRAREKLIPLDVLPRLSSYSGGIARNLKGVLVAAGGMEDHFHQLVSIHPTVAISDLIRDLKANSSRWLKDVLNRDFAWQSGYAAYSVSASNVEAVRDYINNQREHHKTMTFEEEYLAFLKKHGIEYDPRYVFD